MELFLFEPDFFYAEGQNDPQDPRAADDKFLRAEDIAKKVTNYIRRQVPLDVRWITAHIDVQKNLLFYKVIGWTPESAPRASSHGPLGAAVNAGGNVSSSRRSARCRRSSTPRSATAGQLAPASV